MLESSKADRATSYRTGGLMLFAAAASILVALGFQYIGGYDPCPLCLMQRYAYYAAVPMLFIAMALASEQPKLAGFIFLLVAIAFLANAGLGTYHAGAEWKYWPGPETCAGGAAPMPTNPADMLKGMENRVVRCDEASWRMFGLSFAGWNIVISLALFALGLRAAATSARGA
jgi:disulfide bond formation protein DsbB